jgi:hypothetical protein
MARSQNQAVRKPATKFAHLRKKMARAKIAAGVGKRAKKSK